MFAPSIRAARGTAALPQAERRTRRGPGGALGNQARLRQLAPQMVQAKLEVGAADDPLEREADRVADTVMRAPVPPPGPAPDDRRIVRRKCDECEEADTVARKGAEGAASLDETAAPAPVHETLAAPGRPLDLETRGFFEPRFGYDFSSVRVHTDAAARDSAAAIGARAYTLDTHIAFSDGAYAPGSIGGRELLAHELAHVVQQSGAGSASAVARDTVDDAEQVAAAPLIALGNKPIGGASGASPIQTARRSSASPSSAGLSPGSICSGRDRC